MRRVDAGVAFNGTRSLATIRGRVLNCVYLGSARKSVIALDGGTTALVRVPQDAANCTLGELGHEVEICWDVEAGIIVPPDTGAAPTRSIATSGHQAER